MTTVYTRAGKGSALTWTEGDANITNLNNDKIEDIVEDTTPQLGGNLDVNGNSIVSASNGDITIAPNGTGDVHLVTDAVRVGDLNTEARISTYGTGNLVLTTNEGHDPDPTITIGNGANADITLTPSGTGIVSIVSDLEVGYGTGTAAITSAGAHDLDLVTNGGTNSGLIRIVDGVNGNIELTPNGTGKINLDGLLWPNADGTNGQVLTTNGTGTLSFSTVSGGIDLTDLSVGAEGTASGDGSIAYNNTTGVFTYTPPTASGIGALADVVNDTTPQLGGNLDVNGQQIVSVSNGNISIQPNGTGQTVVKNIEYNENIFSLGTTSGTITPDVANGNVQTITLSGNLTFSAFSNPIAGQSLTLIINTNSTNRTLTSTMKFAGGSKTLSITNTTDIISVFYDGTNYWASLSKGFV